MTIEEAILERVRALPPDQKKEVLDFAEFLGKRPVSDAARTPLRGLWKDLGVSISESDIAEARREMWGNFARDDI
jgi:hypothetical protein